MIQMPRPCVAITRSCSRGWTGQVAHRDRREVAALELRPALAAVDRDPQPELGAEEQQVLLDRVLLDHVRVAADALSARRAASSVLP